MKSTNRIHRNGAAKPVKPQAEKLNSVDIIRLRGVAEDMNQAAIKSDVLLQLINHHLDWREHRSGSFFEGAQADRFNWGLAMLIDEARCDLKECVSHVMSLAYNKTPEVAS
jgi:hypothetical protein